MTAAPTMPTYRCPETKDIEDIPAADTGQRYWSVDPALIAHVEMIHQLAEPLDGKGKLIVAAFGEDPATGKKIAAKIESFRIGDLAGMVKAINRLAHERHRNVYVPLAVMRGDLPAGGKGTEADVIGVLGLVADFDDAAAADYARRLPVTAPYVLETSAGRFQAFLPFDRPMSVADAKSVALALKEAAGCDHATADMSHVWRVPGVRNWPNKRKVDAGRSAEPQPVHVVEPWDGAVISLDDIRKVLPERQRTTELRRDQFARPADPHDLPQGLIDRMNAAPPQGQRSDNAFFVLCALVEHGWSDEAIFAEAQRYAHGFGERYAGKEKELRAEIGRARAKAKGDRRDYPGSRQEGFRNGRANGTAHQTSRAKARPDQEPQAREGIAEGAEPVEPPPNRAEPGDLASFLNATNWLGRTLETPEPLLGEVLTNTTRMFLGGPTGLGKTHVGFGMAAGMATGEGFLHWKASRASRVLYLDGEMSRDLVQERLADLKRRFGGVELSNLFVLCAEDREEIAAMCPDLGEMGPLNTAEGQAFVLKLIDRIGGVDAVFLDNRMSLLSGDMKEEQPWTDTMKLVKELTRRRIAQVWIDHTGHDTGRIYGTKTKEWQFDTVALMEKADRPGTDIAFSLKFEKARRRKPSNRANFELITATLANDEWTVEGATNAGTRRKVSTMAAAFHNALLDALVITPTPGSATRDLWYAECVRGGLLGPIHADDSREAADRKRSKLRKYIAELKAAGWIGVNGETVRSLAVNPAELLPNRAEPPPNYGGVNPVQNAEPSASAPPNHAAEPAEPPPNPTASNPGQGAEKTAEPFAEPLPNLLPNPAKPGDLASDDGEAKPAESGGFPVPNPAQSAEPAEPRKQGAEPLPNLSVPNLPNPAEPLPNPCRTSAELSGGTLPNLPNPVSIDGFGGTAVRQPVRLDPDEADRLHRIVGQAGKLADLSERLDQFAWLAEFKPVVPELAGTKGLRQVKP